MSSPIVVTKIDQDKLVVTQANRLAEASYTMSLEEKRVVLLLLSLVRKEDKDFQTYRIPIADIRDYLGLSTNKLYDDIKRVAGSLVGRVLHIQEDGGGWLKVGWVSSARYVPKGVDGAGVASLDLRFAPEMKPYLLELKSHFAGFMLQNVAALHSFYSIRLYELLKSRRRLGSTTLAVEALRHILKAESKYANYKDFRARVILPARSELAAKTDLTFDFTEARKGRKVVSITFHIRDKAPASQQRAPAQHPQPPLLPLPEADAKRARLVAEAMAEGIRNGVRESAMRELLATRDPAHVLENIELARTRHFSAKGKDAGNLAGLTVAAITGDYAADGREDRERAAEGKEARERAKAARALVGDITTTADAVRKRDIAERLAAMPKAECDALRSRFASEIQDGKHGEVIAVAFQRNGWKGLEGQFRLFAAECLGMDGGDAYARAEAARRGLDWDGLCADAA